MAEQGCDGPATHGCLIARGGGFKAVGVFLGGGFSLNGRRRGLRFHSQGFLGRGFLGGYMPSLVVFLHGFEAEPSRFFFLLTSSTVANGFDGFVLPKYP